MHQTLYIDVDEEVNSIISRIRKSLAKYNILVVTHGALVMQSAVSLKLIKREADSLGKKIMIITKDELAASIAKKIGFSVRSSLEDLRELERREETNLKNTSNNIDRFSVKNDVSIDDTKRVLEKNNRLGSLGGESFYAGEKSFKGNSDGFGKIELNSKNISVDNHENPVRVSDNTRDGFSPDDDEEFKHLFDGSAKSSVKNKEDKSKRKFGLFFGLLIFLLLILTSLILAYFYLPKAKVTVFPKKDDELVNLRLEVSENNFTEGSDIISLKPQIIESENLLSLSFPATGQKNSSNQKAKGKILIYNEFSETSQVLVATTRILSNNEKLFRLINNVTVPGMVIKDGVVEPGTIEAEIIADDSGEDYNLNEAEFRIPGFKGSPKYDKFYAKLLGETKGGGGGEGELKTVSGSDIESAKIKTENQLKEKLREDLKGKIGENRTLFDNAISYEVLDFSIFPEEDSVTENFEYQVRMKARGIAFLNNELDEKIQSLIKGRISQKNISLEIIDIEKNYGNASVDFSKKSIKTELRVKASVLAKIDEGKLAEYLVGKDKDEIADIIETFPEINKIEASISPSIISNNFPRDPSRIEIKTEK